MTPGLAARSPQSLRRLARRLRGPDANARRAYARWREQVEPELLTGLRVQRFARPTTVVGERTVPAEVEVVTDPAALNETRADWVLVVDPRARLAPGAPEAFGRAATVAAGAAVITCDEDRCDARGRRAQPIVRPGPSPDLLATVDLAGAAILVDRRRALAAGVALDHPGWRLAVTRTLTGTDGSGAAHVSAILAHREGDDRTQPPAVGDRPTAPGVTGEPVVEVIIPFRDRHELLDRAVNSLLATTHWALLQVTLIDNGSAIPPPDHITGDARVSVVADPRPFNFAALCNAAAGRSRADVLVLLNNDTEVVEPGWLERLVGEAQRPEVGAVAPLLTYPDGKVQHAGVAVGLFGLAGHPFAGLAPEERGPFGAATDGTRNWMAVTAGCLVIERAKFVAVGGFDEGFVVGGQDVDLGIRLTARGHRSLCVTDVRVIHDEARSRGDHVAATDPTHSERAYGAFRTDGDPFYSPALTLAATNCGLRTAGEPW